jgi:hypothetical protein
MVEYRPAAIKILTEAQKPLSAKEITEIAIKRNLIRPGGNTPIKSMYSLLYRDAKKGEGSDFAMQGSLFYLRLNSKKKSKHYY